MIALAANRIDPHPADCQCSDCMARPLLDPCNILSHARGMMIEQIMALEGRGHSNPRAFRDELERESSMQLSHRLELLTDFPGFGSDPAPQETTDDIHSALRRSGASTAARETLILQSSLP